jgi:hypothetical protein
MNYILKLKIVVHYTKLSDKSQDPPKKLPTKKYQRHTLYKNIGQISRGQNPLSTKKNNFPNPLAE